MHFLRADRTVQKRPNCGRPRGESNAIYVTYASGLRTHAFLRAFLAIRAISLAVAVCMHFLRASAWFWGVGRPVRMHIYVQNVRF